jgi:catechol 2,3-dioxygenase-like lactoylglutathione lyase family enzyme
MRPVGSLLICAALALGICAVADARAEVLALRRIGVTVADLDRTERFYRDALDFQTISRSAGAETDVARLLARPGEHVEVLRMRLGAEEVEFLRFDRPGRHYPTDTQGPDRWFQHFAVVVSDMDAAYARLQEVGLDAFPKAARRRFLSATDMSRRSSSATRTGTRWSFSPSHRARVARSGTSGPACSWASTTAPFQSRRPKLVSRSIATCWAYASCMA